MDSRQKAAAGVHESQCSRLLFTLSAHRFRHSDTATEYAPRRVPSCVPMSMMDIRVMRMAVRDGLVGVLVRVRLTPVPWEVVCMLMMCIVHMAVRMRDGLVGVHVLMALGQVQPDTHGHQRRGYPEHPGRMFSQRQDRNGRAYERRG